MCEAVSELKKKSPTQLTPLMSRVGTREEKRREEKRRESGSEEASW